ncbi:nitrite/sulfite reductase [Roseivirga spongicola]|uniref:nitrite/sulfite reductase n=1 Tax=Roseivirga spongicola TaxID=333140 RepID=UPI002AC971FD|nr:nitrite/sulfite reductase [Roseivirga spongicola]WPZ08566.1 nitrite/sulfite reductase [Roseivirga spongicola]
MSLTYKNNISAAAKKDILELEKRIEKFNQGEIAEDKFKLYRLTRGVYGQRQTGVQMIRIKLPYGKVTPQQLITIANVSDKYATGNLHLTTRQDIQLHFVKLADSPALWAELEESDVTLREACGNTVRNVTASPDAGVNPNEPFDVTPYAHALTHFFLRNPICQDMGRKMKIAFTADEQDTAMTYFHDIGFIPKVENGTKGFKIVVGGGLGAVAMTAQTAHEFLPAEEIIPFSEALIRVFDRYGERANRNKARLKFLLKNIGLEKLMELINEERKSLKATATDFDLSLTEANIPEIKAIPETQIEDWEAFENWKRTNTFEQKQQGYYGIWLRVPLGDIDSNRARKLAALVQEFAGDDIRVTANQGLLLKYVRPDLLPFFFQSLTELNLAKPGFNSTHDITSCPGSDTCNLAVTNSTGLATALENLLAKNFKHLIDESNIKIKISGCMNACGQHMAANIGFHGSSIKHNGLVIPAMQVVIGGGISPTGEGFMAEKVIKLPTKRIPTALSLLLNAFETNADWGEYFNDFYQRLGKRHFYHLLKPLAELETLDQAEYIDWGKEEKFIPEIGVGECASVMLDVIGTIIDEAQERLEWAEAGLKEAAHADAIYNSYSAFVIGAKALLLSEDVKCNTQIGILESFEEVFGNNARFTFAEGFKAYVLRMQQHEPSAEFAQEYFNQSTEFLRTVRNHRGEQLAAQGEDKVVISDFYKA